MVNPCAVPLTDLDWVDDVPGIRERSMEVDHARWAIVEYAEGAGREQWCVEGHRGFVLEGRIEYEFADNQENLSASEGQAFLLPAGTAHRGRNLASGPTTMFLIDDAIETQ